MVGGLEHMEEFGIFVRYGQGQNKFRYSPVRSSSPPPSESLLDDPCTGIELNLW